MTKEEYDIKLKEIYNLYLIKRRDLCKKYALSNSPYKIGDIIEDHMYRIEIKQIKISQESSNGYPCCVYHGLILKKNGDIRQDGKTHDVFQTNIKRKD